MSHYLAPERLWAAIVVYQPDLQVLASNMARLAPQVRTLVIADNTPNAVGLRPLCQQYGARYLSMSENAGTGAAMNRIWALMSSERADGLICFDQDSVFDAGLVATLCSAWNSLAAAGQWAGAVGPVWRDRRNHKLMTTLLPRGLARHPVDRVPITEVDHLITSGCLIPSAVFDRVGPYNEGLFLDCVDIEWCLRARMLGYKFFVVRDSELSHVIGEQLIQIANSSLIVHTPVRTYLMVRNHVILWRMPWLSSAWKLRDVGWVTLRSAALLGFAPQRMARLAAMILGLVHGLRNKTGKPPPFIMCRESR